MAVCGGPGGALDLRLFRLAGERMVAIRNVLLGAGGATFRHSMLRGMSYSPDHQVVFVPETRTLWMKVVDRDWQKVEPGQLFSV